MSVSRRALSAFLEQEALPDSYAQQAQHFFLPFLEGVHRAVAEDRLKVLGIHGAQGSGKSTLAALIQWYFQHELGLNVVQLSLDDFYLTKAQRRSLSERVHPLFATRGVPGTHDCNLAMASLQQLRDLSSDQSCSVPRFDKAVDDRLPESQWPTVYGPVDLIVFEGWCVGAVAEHEEALASAVNALEEQEDGECIWRHQVNQTLANTYQRLFAQLDYLLMLKAPDFDCVAGWRLQQEQKLMRFSIS